MFSSRIMNIIGGLYQWIVSFFSHFQGLFLLFIRIVWGHQFFMVGIRKLAHPEKVALFFDNLGIPLSTFHVYLVSYFEVIGGLCLVFGFAARLFSIPLSIIMLTAYATAHSYIFSHWSILLNPHAIVQEPPFAFLMTCLVILVFGPGRFSIDGWIKRWLSKRQY